MFLSVKRSGYTRNGEQFTQGRFLVFLADKNRPKIGQPIRCIVRYTSLRQFGHWMMGTIRVKGRSIIVSGDYGGDGLTKDVDTDIYESGVELPQDLFDLWNHGNGWNGAGSEAEEIRKWAIKTFPKELMPRPIR